MIIFAKICISIHYTDFITQNVQPAFNSDSLGSDAPNHERLLLIHPKIIISSFFESAIVYFFFLIKRGFFYRCIRNTAT